MQNVIEKRPSKSNNGRKKPVVCNARLINRAALLPLREKILIWKGYNGGPRNPCTNRGTWCFFSSLDSLLGSLYKTVFSKHTTQLLIDQ